MDTETLVTHLRLEKPLEDVVILEPIPNEPDEDSELYEAELMVIFGFDPRSDPDPSEWFSPDELTAFTPYLETVRRARHAGKASLELEAARAERRRLDRAGFGELRLRAEDRLRIRRQGLELPTDLRFV